MHPTTRFLLWLFLVIGVQNLHGAALAGAFVLPAFGGGAALRRGLRLVRRARWLLLTLFVVLAWGVAGDPLWNSDFAPTREGLAEAATHLGRLLLVLLAVGYLLERLPLPDLLAALYPLLEPLRRLGYDPDRGVVRLMLVLRYVETLPRPRDWRVLLQAPQLVDDAPLVVGESPLRGRDQVMIMIGAALLLAVCFV